MSGRLFHPLTLGPLTLKNRIVALPVYMGYAQDGQLTPAMEAHYEELGATGAAMVVVESTLVHPSGLATPRLFRVDDDRCLPALRSLAQAIKAGGALACCQINHPGSFAAAAAPGPVSASAVPCAPGAPVPRPLAADEIPEIVASYAQAARRVREAGFDAVEVHGGTEYLIVQFFSPRTNRRDDAYGGTLENRMRFPLEVARAVRAAVGPGYPVGWRFQADEWLPDGITLDDSVELARRLEAEGISYLSVMCGSYAALAVPENFMRTTQPGYMVPAAVRIKQAVGRPVIAAGRIATPEVAEEILADGRADLVGLGRVLLADPEWVVKAREGRGADIVSCKPDCTVCGQLVLQDRPVFCVRWGREKRERLRALLGADVPRDLPESPC